ncbi:hypothetical protein EOD23_26615 [Mesorhizobium sp. USDA-HM6]|nr:hypothetical protein EOD23_26615 [Mesorhizobium sp. USDA-HM6]
MRTKASGSLIGARRRPAMNQFLAILNDVMRIATFQWHGEAARSRCCHDHPDCSFHDAPRTDRHPARRTRP